MILNIISINATTSTITVGGDYTVPLTAGVKFQLFTGTNFAISPAPDGLWTVVSATLNAGNTDIVVAEVIPPTLTATQLWSAIYEINFANPTALPFFVYPETVDGPEHPSQHTQLMLNGKGSMAYGENLLENMVHLLENFSSTVAPTTPIIGQLWYDLTTTQFKVWNETAWAFVTNQVKPYDFFTNTIGSPVANAAVARFVVGRNFTTPLNLVGSQAVAEVAATASTVFSVNKNGVQFATITYGIGSAFGIFSGTAESFIPGDKLTIVAPSTPDTTLASLTFNIVGDLV